MEVWIFGYYLQPKASTWVKTDPNATTNKIASLRTDIAEKERRIAQLSNENEKLNKQKLQSTTLLNGLQRENSAKDALVHQAKRQTEKLKKRIQQFPPCRRRLDIIHEANVALTSKIILIVACEYSFLSTVPFVGKFREAPSATWRSC